ncbi:hypothetical protein SteCoe_19598 [Stentor coeruleus]|uniref:Uncharacterized protein n=1 Tax=Stentor coeruleus TaxID=5963 RepID=A0A1R2BTP6_9CILI|nr:hypothetical protein SteCoe_19598 [Stentor coeruleus]
MNLSPKALLAADSSRLQVQISHKILSNSTFESLHRSINIDSKREKPDQMISRRLKNQRHPLSGLKNLLPEMYEQLALDPGSLVSELNNSHKLNSRILETWINNTISDATFINLPNQLSKQELSSPLMRYGVDRTGLLKAGLQTEDIDRLYRSLFVYSIGFYQLIQTILKHSFNKYSIVTGIWKVYAILLEYCCQLDYEMIVTTLNSEKKEEIEQMEYDFMLQINKLEAKEKEMQNNITFAKIQLQEVQKELRNEVDKREEIEEELLRRGLGHDEEVTMRLLFESKLNQMYAMIRDFHTKIELLNESLNNLQKDSEKRAEKYEKEHQKNINLSRIRAEIEREMRKTEEKYKQTEIINISLDNRITECYTKIETLSIQYGNLSIEHSETQNELAQKKIEADNLKMSLEIIQAKSGKMESMILEYEKEKEISIKRIKELETTLANETAENKFYRQEYVKIKESNKVNGSEVLYYKEKSLLFENDFLTAVKDKNALSINLESMNTLSNELKINLKDAQQKIEQMSKSRISLKDRLQNQQNKIEAKDKEIREYEAEMKSLKEELEKYKNQNYDMEMETTDLRIKLESTQKQFETTKETLNNKITNLYEILESEKKIRETWISRFEVEQQDHADVTQQFILTQDKLNKAIFTNKKTMEYLDEADTQKKKLEKSHKEDMEEILKLRFLNEELNRKCKTLKILTDNIERDYIKGEEELKINYENSIKILQQEIQIACMRNEEIWAYAMINYQKIQDLEYKDKIESQKNAYLEATLAETREFLEEKTLCWEQKSMLLEETRIDLISLNNSISDFKATIENLETESNNTKKQLEDMKSLIPVELRNLSNPFESLVNKKPEVTEKVDFSENYSIEKMDFTNNYSPETADQNLQYTEPKPQLLEKEIMTDFIIFENPENILNISSTLKDRIQYMDLPIQDLSLYEIRAPRSGSSKASKISHKNSIRRQSSRIKLSSRAKNTSFLDVRTENFVNDRERKIDSFLDVRTENFVNDREKKIDSFLDVRTENFVNDRERKIDSFDSPIVIKDDERITPLNLKSVYTKEVKTPEPPDVFLKFPNRLPSIRSKNRIIQASFQAHTPTPKPSLPSNDFKRALKQVVSRKKHD